VFALPGGSVLSCVWYGLGTVQRSLQSWVRLATRAASSPYTAAVLEAVNYDSARRLRSISLKASHTVPLLVRQILLSGRLHQQRCIQMPIRQLLRRRFSHPRGLCTWRIWRLPWLKHPFMQWPVPSRLLL
jgi:hypothetical protein